MQKTKKAKQAKQTKQAKKFKAMMKYWKKRFANLYPRDADTERSLL